MEIQQPPANHGKAVSEVAKDKSHAKSSHGEAVSEVAQGKSASQMSRELSNATLLSALEEVSISSGNKAMTLLYRAAIDAIDEYLAPTKGPNATQRAFDEGVDTSPEATAGRIVDFSTQFFSVYQGQNSSLSYEEQVDGFLEVIGGAIDKGIGEAKDILEGLQVYEGSIAEDVEATQALVHQGLEEFRERMLGESSQEPEPTGSIED